MADRIIREIEKNSREKVRISLTEYKGKKLVDIRVYWMDDANEFQPGKGVTMRRECLPDLADAVTAAAEAAGEEGGDSD